MTIEVPAERIDTEVDKRLHSLKQSVKFKGFRPGKVPLKIVKQQYGTKVYKEVMGEVLHSCFLEAINQQKLRMAGQPLLEPKTIAPGQNLEFVATFEVYPEFEPAPVEDLEIIRPKSEVKDNDINEMLEELRKRRSTWHLVERAAQESDQVVIDFEGTIDGEAFDGNKAQNLAVEIGKEQLIPGFEEQLIGLKANDEKTFELEFPEKYGVDQLSGKTAEFRVTVTQVSESVLPEVDEDFARSFDVHERGVEGLREQIKADLQERMHKAVMNRVKTQVMHNLLGINEFDVPEALIEEEIKRLRKQTMERTGLSDESQFPDMLFEENARKRVGLGLIIGNMIQKNELKLNRMRVDKALQEITANYEEPEQVMRQYRENERAMAGLEAAVMEDQVVDWVVERAKVKDEPTSFAELMKPVVTDFTTGEGEHEQEEL